MSEPPPPGPTAEEYAILDRYLRAAIKLLEGIADVEEAQISLSYYLAYHRAKGLPPELEELLIQLFFQKCSKEFSREATQQDKARE